MSSQVPSADERLRGLFDHSDVGVSYTSFDGTIIDANEALCALWGRRREDVVGHLAVEMVHLDDRTAASDLAAFLAGDHHVRHRTRYQRPDGSAVWGDAFTQVVRDGEGRPVCLQCVVVDATDRQRRPEVESGLMALLESWPDALIGIGSDDVVRFASREAERMFGYGLDELIGQPVELIFPEHVEAVRSGQRPELTGELVLGEVRTATLIARRRDGSEFPAEVSLSVSETGRGRERWAAFRDGTERMQAAIVASSAEAIIGESLDGVITSWNAAAEGLFGYRITEVIGRPASVLLPPERAGEVAANLERLVRDEAVERYETQRVRKDGAVVDVAVTLSPIRDPGGTVVGASVAAYDITARKRGEAERRALQERLQQVQRLESLGQLAGGVAHDFNNLLAVILNYAAFVRDNTSDKPDVQSDLDQIRMAAEQGARLTRQLMMFARRERLEPESLDLNDIVGDTAALLARSLGEDVEIRLELAPGLPLIQADRGHLEQILLNLAVNARDAMPGGGVLAIQTAAATSDDPGVPCVQLSVTDTGTGMSPEVASRVFEPFFTTKAEAEGTGLGLATVYGAVAAAGGTVTVASTLGEGSCFIVRLPAEGP
jgi:hypothetical protein